MLRKITLAVVANVVLLGVLVALPVAAEGKGSSSGNSNPHDAYGYQPGWGHGDDNHHHQGPPGLLKKVLTQVGEVLKSVTSLLQQVLNVVETLIKGLTGLLLGQGGAAPESPPVYVAGGTGVHRVGG